MTNHELNLTVRSYPIFVICEHTPEVPAKLDAAPEDCCPEEPEELEILEMYFAGSKVGIQFNLTEISSEGFLAEVKEKAIEEITEQEKPDEG